MTLWHLQAKCERRLDELRALSEEAGRARGLHELLSLDLLDDISAMFMNAAWHAAYVRLSWGREKAAAAAKSEFDQRYAYVRESGELSEALSLHLKWMCWNVSWYTANSRAGNTKDAARDKVGYERHARACVGGIHRGVSLEGWLILRRGVSEGNELSETHGIR